MAMGTPDRVAVVSSAQTRLKKTWSNLQHVDLIALAVTDALRGSGLTMKDVDVIIDCGSDVLDGRSISNCGFLGAMGAHHKEESRVEEDGLFGAIYAATKVAGGAASVALVVAYSKPSESDIAAYYSTLAEPFYQRPIGIDHLVAAGLMANQYLTHSGAKDEDLVGIAAHAWTNAVANPYVETAGSVSADDIRSAGLVADPLTGLQVARPMDGAVAVLLVNERVARRLTPNPVWITGMGAAMDSQFLAERAPGKLEACAAAGRMALARAGITDPNTFHLAEVSGGSAAGEAMVVEALGLAAPGHAIDRYAGAGSLSLNPSGGAIPADPVMATGLVRLHEATARLGGRSEQNSTASSALVHGAGGLAMQNHCVFTLEV
jgi:acetyl-CoA C-acetyltransferase